MALLMLNPNADRISSDALEINIRAAVSLKDILKTNLGPRGKLKMLVSGSGDITLTKDGAVLLKNMQIEHPTASLIARNAAAQDDITGDGSTSVVVFIGELLQQSLYHVNEGVHPRIISEGIEIARKESLEFLGKFVTKITNTEDRELLCNIARTSLRTKLPRDIADHLTEIVVDSVRTIQKPGSPIDLYMVEMMSMEHKSVLESSLVDGLVLDHGFRHPLMPKRSKNCHILVCNVSLEYEKTEVNSQFYYSTAEQKEQMVKSERGHLNEKLRAIVELKNKVCNGKESSFAVINQKGIDPLSLDYLHKNGIVALRRAKRRNMERLTLACGGYPVNSIEGLSPKCLGFAGSVTEYTLGEDKYTFVEDVKNPFSCTILLRGPNNYTIAQMKDAMRDGLRAVKAALDGKKVVAGGGAFEVACYKHLKKYEESAKIGKASYGVKVFADALLSIPKTLAVNAGLDAHDCVLGILDALNEASGEDAPKIGLNVEDGSPMSPEDEGVWDNYKSKRQMVHLGAIMAENLLVVDEIIRAGKIQRGQ